MKPKIRTHIEGFDNLLDGGVPKCHNVLIAGSAGTMKTSLAYSILHNNALAENRKGLYISLEQSKSSLLDQVSSLGMSPQTLKKKISILDLTTLRRKMRDLEEDVWMDFITMYTKSIKGGFDFELLVLDSLNALEALGDFDVFRLDFFRLLRWFKELGSTSFIIAETPQSVISSGFAPDLWNFCGKHKEEYLADGIIILEMTKRGDSEVQRRIRCVKMRSVNHDPGYFAIVFEGGRFQVTRIIS